MYNPSLYLKKELSLLEIEIKAAKQFLKKQQLLKKPQIFILLGAPKTGKSTLLANAGLHLVDYHLAPPKLIGPTQTCTFWYSHQGLFIDTAGIYTQANNSAYPNHRLWLGLIKLISRYFGRDAIHALLLVFDLHQMLAQEDQLTRILASFRKRIHETQEYVATFQIYLIMTKCDHLIGSKEYFQLASPAQLSQPFGITFDTNVSNVCLTFPNQLDALTDQLQKQVNHYDLIDESTSQVHYRAKLFPVYFAQLKPLLCAIIKQIPNHPGIELKGLFFTSSIQTTSLEYPFNSYLNNLGININYQDHLATQMVEPSLAVPLFRFLLKQTKPTLQVDYRRFYLSLSLLGLFVITIMSTCFYQRFKTISTIKAGIFTPESQKITPKDLKTNPFFSLNNSKLATQFLQWKQTSQQLPWYQQKTAEILKKQTQAHNLEAVNDTLRAYLAFATHLQSEKIFLKNWLMQKLNITWNPNYPAMKIPLDEQLILESQQLLLNQEIISPTVQSKFRWNAKTRFIPEMYLKKHFQRYYDSKCRSLIIQLPKLPSQSITALKQKKQQIYQLRYLNFWQEQLNTLLEPTSLPQKLTQYQKANTLPPEWQLVVDNLPPNLECFRQLTTQITQGWHNFQQESNKLLLFLSEQSDAHQWLQTYYRSNGKNWHTFVQTIHDVPGYTSFITALQQQTLALIATRVLVQIKQAWNNEVVPVYQKLIDGYYPFNATSDQDLPLANFHRFFGPQQSLEKFFLRYLKPYVVTDAHFNWHWKTLNDQPLPFGDYFLDIGLRGALIQKAFYSNHQYGFSFSLAYLAQHPKFNLTVNHHQLNLSTIPMFTWPTNYSISLSYPFNNQVINLSYQGIWAWFRLFDQLHLQHIKGGKFKIPLENETIYLLTNRFNPFLPDLINDFVCQLR